MVGVLVTLLVILILSFFQLRLFWWALALLALAYAGIVTGHATIWALIPGALFLLLSFTPIRKILFTGPAYAMVKKILPRVSATEQEALDAGTIGWDAELFSGRPDWRELFAIRKAELSDEEQAFFDGPVDEVCKLISDWETRHVRAELPKVVWDAFKKHKLLGMLISKEHGGLGFSAQAQSMIVSKISSRSVAAGITVMVPNSLGPGELLEKYGTDAQKKKYLQRLAQGREVPCFALTGPHSGSDAANMRDIGVVTYATYQGKKTLGVKLNWEKRFITLGPIATLLGLAFRLEDPDELLGKGKNIGITLALIPTDFPGVSIGRRHYPARSAFMNGPNYGKDVFIPLDFLIGGIDYVGQGWRMLMECLSVGRAISLPAIGTISIKHALRTTSAYARIRRQFSIPIGVMEGVAEPLARITKLAYTFEASRGMTAAMVDDGQKPAVISALLKYQTTQAMREAVDDAMDIHGGRAVCDGPSNYLFSVYQNVPVAITVEGANILTRTLITFAQGALRAHPFLYAEVAAAQNPDRKQGLAAFDKAFSGHIGFILRNVSASLFHNLTFGRLAPAPDVGPTKKYYRQLYRQSQNFALVGDLTVSFLAGDLKRKQMLSGRMADVLSHLYLLSTVLKRFEDEGRITDDLPLVDAIAKDRLAAIEQALSEVADNFPNAFLRFAIRRLVFPLGRLGRPSKDRDNFRLARAMLKSGPQRDRLTNGLYHTMDPSDPVGVLEDCLVKVEAAEEAEGKLRRALRKGTLERRYDRDVIDDAIAEKVLTKAEAKIMRIADEATNAVIAVDDFAPGELGQKAAPKRVATKRTVRKKPART